MDLTIVGAGVGGSALVREARKRGHNTKLVSQGQPASAVALAIVREAYVTRHAGGREAARYALDAYRAAGCEVVDGALVSAYSGKQPHLRDDWHAVNPSGYLLEPDLVESLSVNDPRADYTIWATGAAALPGDITFGATWVNDNPGALRESFAVHQYAPYRTADAVRYKDGCRVGSSSSVSLQGAIAGAWNIAKVAKERGWLVEEKGWQLVTGARVQRTSMLSVEDGRILFGGFHRDGYAMAPKLAEHMVKILESGRVDALLRDGGVTWLSLADSPSGSGNRG